MKETCYLILRKEVDWEHKHLTGLILYVVGLSGSGIMIEYNQCLMSENIRRILITLLTADLNQLLKGLMCRSMTLVLTLVLTV
jgi:hypothetical protein